MDKMVKDPDVKEEDMKKKRLKEKKKREKEMQKATMEEEDSATCAGTDKICKRMLRLEKLFEIHDSKALRELEGEDGKEDEIEVADLFAKLEAKIVNVLKKQNEITNSIHDTKVKEDRQHYETRLAAKEMALALGRLERQQAEMYGMVKRIDETHSKIGIVFLSK